MTAKKSPQKAGKNFKKIQRRGERFFPGGRNSYSSVHNIELSG